MIEGLFLDPRTWQIDFKSSPFWNPERFGVKIDLHPDAFKIPKVGVSKKYKFVIATEVWEIPTRITLKYLREQGLKVFFIPREPVKAKILKDALFSYDKFLYEGLYYFSPDMLLAAGDRFAEFWKGRVKCEVIGYPRFEQYISEYNIEDICKKHDLDKNKIKIFFPSFPAYHYCKVNGKDVLLDLTKEHEEIMLGLEELSKNGFQIIVKVHPVSQKCYDKKTGSGREIFGTFEKYYKNRSENFVVIADKRNSGNISKNLLRSCDLIVGFASTMLLEAQILKKPSLNLLFGKTKDMQGLIEYEDCLLTSYNKEEMCEAVISKSAFEFKPSKLLNEYLYKIDGKFCERLCNIIKRECK